MQVSFFAPSLVSSAPAAPTAADQTAEAKGGNAGVFASLLDSQPKGGAAQKDCASAGNPKAKTPVPGASSPRRETPCATWDQVECAPAETADPEADVSEPVNDDAESGVGVPADGAPVVPAPVLPAPVPLLEPVDPTLPVVEKWPAVTPSPQPEAMETEKRATDASAAAEPEEREVPEQADAPEAAKPIPASAPFSPAAAAEAPTRSSPAPAAPAVTAKRDRSATKPAVPAEARPTAITPGAPQMVTRPDAREQAPVAQPAAPGNAVPASVTPVTPPAVAVPRQAVPTATLLGRPPGAVESDRSPSAAVSFALPRPQPAVAEREEPVSASGAPAPRSAASAVEIPIANLSDTTSPATIFGPAVPVAPVIDAPAGLPAAAVEAFGPTVPSQRVSWHSAEQARATGAQIVLQNTATSRAPAAPNPLASSSAETPLAGNPVANPVLASPTLAQVLVETGAVAAPRPSPTTQATAPVAGAVPIPPDAPEIGVAAREAPLDAETRTAGDQPSVEEETRTERTVRGLREILAAGGGRATRSDASAPKGATSQNFLNVEKQRVGAEEAEIGTRTANRAQPMSSHAPAQFAADAVLDVFELPGAAAPIASPSTGTSLKPGAEVATPRSFAAAAVREAMNAVEKAQETGRTHIELRLPTQDNEGLRVHLDWRDGVVHARFVAPTSEMQHSLSREWETVAPRFAERGLKFSEPSFEHHGQSSDPQPGQTGFASDQQRHRSRGHSAGGDDLPEFALPTAPAAGTAASSRRAAPRAAANPSHEWTDTRGLRVWA